MWDYKMWGDDEKLDRLKPEPPKRKFGDVIKELIAFESEVDKLKHESISLKSEVSRLKSELSALKYELRVTQHSDRDNQRLKLENQRLRRELELNRGRYNSTDTSWVKRYIKFLIFACHPDRNGGKTDALEVTKILIGLR
jgi:hypothetical protein